MGKLSRRVTRETEIVYEDWIQIDKKSVALPFKDYEAVEIAINDFTKGELHELRIANLKACREQVREK